MLDQEPCTACSPGSHKLTDTEINRFLASLPSWVSVSENGITKARREFTFSDYAQGLNFTNELANLAEQENHHPDILLQWGKVTVTWWTHTIAGLHRNDFIMAAKTDQLLKL
jgi:4a-hydroxytetrahydrobiopterin dehydratase